MLCDCNCGGAASIGNEDSPFQSPSYRKAVRTLPAGLNEFQLLSRLKNSGRNSPGAYGNQIRASSISSSTLSSPSSGFTSATSNATGHRQASRQGRHPRSRGSYVARESPACLFPFSPPSIPARGRPRWLSQLCRSRLAAARNRHLGDSGQSPASLGSLGAIRGGCVTSAEVTRDIVLAGDCFQARFFFGAGFHSHETAWVEATPHRHIDGTGYFPGRAISSR